MFLLTIHTPEFEFREPRVLFVGVETPQGHVSILPNHVELITSIESSEMLVDTPEGIKYFHIFTGILRVLPDHSVEVVAETAESSEVINITEAKLAQARAEEILIKRETLAAEEIIFAKRVLSKNLSRINVHHRHTKRNEGITNVGVFSE